MSKWNACFFIDYIESAEEEEEEEEEDDEEEVHKDQWDASAEDAPWQPFHLVPDEIGEFGIRDKSEINLKRRQRMSRWLSMFWQMIVLATLLYYKHNGLR